MEQQRDKQSWQLPNNATLCDMLKPRASRCLQLNLKLNPKLSLKLSQDWNLSQPHTLTMYQRKHYPP
jgi:hypothetical protein